MKYRTLGKTGYKISEVSYGAWSLGADWGNVSDEEAMTTLNKAIDLGVNFIDTADVYGDGRSERLIGRLLKQRKERIYVATKAGRRLNPHIATGYTKKNLNAFVDRSLGNLGVQTLDLLQLHCPPTDVYYNQEVIEALEEMIINKKIRYYGFSVEKVEEGLKALEYPGLATIQIIYNIFRQRPAELFFEQAKMKHVGVIVRVPLASGLLSGKMTNETIFAENDHRNYNREGQAFDVGETFAGVPYLIGLEAVDQLKMIKPQELTMPQMALKWILENEAVSTVIPGAKNPKQVEDNVETSSLPNLSTDLINKIGEIYIKYVKPLVHQRW